jgi:TRAP-type C4-dicarboxylate transport system permease small subunit
VFIFQFFESLAKLIEGTFDAIQNGWRRFVSEPLQSLFFYIILFLAGVIAILRATCEEVDRMLSHIEKALISIALLTMVGLSFLDYLRREVSFFSFEIQGGAGMAVVLMVWVGFLGASLASRQKKHLAVDATDRILSPGAAKLVKRFGAFIAAGFCWKLSGYSMELVNQSLIGGAGQDTVPLWGFLEGPVNTLGGFLHPEEGDNTIVAIGSIVVLFLLVYML